MQYSLPCLTCHLHILVRHTPIATLTFITCEEIKLWKWSKNQSQVPTNPSKKELADDNDDGCIIHGVNSVTIIYNLVLLSSEVESEQM